MCESINLSLCSIQIVQVYSSLIGQEVENVESSDCFWPPLLVAENEIDPLVKLTRDKLTLQRLSGDRGKSKEWEEANKNIISLCPQVESKGVCVFRKEVCPLPFCLCGQSLQVS